MAHLFSSGLLSSIVSIVCLGGGDGDESRSDYHTKKRKEKGWVNIKKKTDRDKLH